MISETHTSTGEKGRKPMSARRAMLVTSLVIPVALGATARAGEADGVPAKRLGDLRAVGTVTLPRSCGPDAQAGIERATALLHSFFYEEARRVFSEAAAQEPGCALAHWGVAMTYWHPIWTPPTPEERAAGREAIERARALGGRTDVERGLIAALSAYYADPAASPAGAQGAGEAGLSCHGLTGGADHAARAQAYEKAMERLFAEHSGDVEVASFYALALLATHPPTDTGLKNPRRATGILEPFYATNPTHPGVMHYLIHGYDFPPVASRGLEAAQAYASIAPWVPHVLHMPSHIFTRLGMWTDVIASNLASADAARQYAASHHPEATSFEELHALDYLLYGYLQRGDDRRAAEVLAATLAVRATYPAADFAAAYAIGAVPARYALERRQWAEAAALVEPRSRSLETFTFGAAHLAFARALGAARAGRAPQARQAMTRLEQLAKGMTDPRQQYFARQADMQLDAVKGWVAFAEGRPDEAERLLREAASADDALGKHPVSPGSLLPAREMLADLLLERGRAKEALVEYEACLKLNPGRLNSLYGAGSAAERAGEKDVARRHYEALAAMVARDASRPEVARARAFLAEASQAPVGRSARWSGTVRP
jgi:tetratricopeptide (TPR) repeat protein